MICDMAVMIYAIWYDVSYGSDDIWLGWCMWWYIIHDMWQWWYVIYDMMYDMAVMMYDMDVYDIWYDV